MTRGLGLLLSFEKPAIKNGFGFKVWGDDTGRHCAIYAASAGKINLELKVKLRSITMTMAMMMMMMMMMMMVSFVTITTTHHVGSDHNDRDCSAH